MSSIVYNLNGGVLQYGIDNPTTNVTALPDPLPRCSKAQFLFAGWYYESTFSTKAIAGTSITSDTALYAKFSIESPTWPSSPEWQNPADINNGNAYEDLDGVTSVDFNKLVLDLMYLKQHAFTSVQIKYGNASSTSTVDILPDLGYALSKAVINKVMQNDGVSESEISTDSIKPGITILGKAGTFTNDANAAAADIASGKTAYVAGIKLTGTLQFITEPIAVIPTTSEQIITPDIGVDGFAAVTVAPIPTQVKSAALNMASGNQVITPTTTGVFLTQVTITKPATLIPENIAKDVDIGGVLGTLITYDEYDGSTTNL